MSVHEIPEPKITRILKSITIQECIVEGYSTPVILVNNIEKVPTNEVIVMLLYSANQLAQFIKEQN